MQSDRLVSVIIVAFNNWPDLELAIQSALNQSYKPIEVIVIDNSSTDATSQIVPGLFGSRVRYVRQANSGEGGGRNEGFRQSNGEFIQFLDGDDFLAPDKIEKQIATFDALPHVDVVYGDVRQFQTSAGPATWEDWDTQDYPDMLATLLSPKGNGAGLLPDSVMFRRRTLELIGPWTENSIILEGNTNTYIGSDQDYWLRAAWSSCRFKYSPDSLCFYRRRAGQLMSDSRASVRAMERVLTSAQEYITREPYRTSVSQRLARLRFHLAISERDSTIENSLSKIKRAREVNQAVVTRVAFAIGWILIVTRMGPYLFGSWLRPIRRGIAKLLGWRS